MITLAFKPEKQPRSMTRSAWREANRWRRVAQRIMNLELKSREAEFRKMYEDAVVFGVGCMIVD